ncbi:hypothetical protein PMN64_41175, partial [Bradyrhizobium sp. UFLA01-814]|uniref:hypothetical protein n=1 Tax=Bradyrhizobium sp. UFLA01-814 TaxID=3023480 RepID=UPI00398A740C
RQLTSPALAGERGVPPPVTPSSGTRSTAEYKLLSARSKTTISLRSLDEGHLLRIGWKARPDWIIQAAICLSQVVFFLHGEHDQVSIPKSVKAEATFTDAPFELPLRSFRCS